MFGDHGQLEEINLNKNKQMDFLLLNQNRKNQKYYKIHFQKN